MDVLRITVSSHRHAASPSSSTSLPTSSATSAPSPMARLIPGWASLSSPSLATSPVHPQDPLTASSSIATVSEGIPDPVSMKRSSSLFESLKGLGIFGHNSRRISSSTLNPNTGDIKDRIRLKANQSIDSVAIDKYWEDIMRTNSDPDYTFDLKPVLLQTSADVEKTAKLLLDGAIAGGHDGGDLYKRMKGFECADFYNKLDLAGRTVFLKVLAQQYGPDHASVLEASSALKTAAARGAEKSVAKLEQKLRIALEPLYLQFFMQIYHHPGGMRFILKMREDLLEVSKTSQEKGLKEMNDVLKGRVQEWFGIASLDLERITWTSPAAILEKLIKYEAVHEIPSWEALKERLMPGRACFAFFHKGMPLEPLAFVHVSFENAIQRNVQTILDNPPILRPENASVAIFYTISSPQKGLSGIDLGNFLIKRVVKEIQKKLPNIKTFTTLSPIPGFRNWLETQLNLSSFSGVSLLLPDEASSLEKCSARNDSAKGDALLKIVLEDGAWMHDAEAARVIKGILMRLCSRYILIEKKRSFALDPVANFHIRNGACVYQLNWMGDSGQKGIAQSYGIMINYLYDLPMVEENNDLYVGKGVITVVDYENDFRWALDQRLSNVRIAGVQAKL
ncbi:hypothetical protein HDU77_002930 [Chytriomyces hyalinus]|nr:hypothetical protein HDU77_002930 [Chytriomyces hyalinus]